MHLIGLSRRYLRQNPTSSTRSTQYLRMRSSGVNASLFDCVTRIYVMERTSSSSGTSASATPSSFSSAIPFALTLLIGTQYLLAPWLERWDRWRTMLDR